jgi:MFS family permease
MPLFVVFGALSDKIGRKWIIMAGLLLAVITYIPIYKAMQSVAGSNVVTATSEANKATGAIKLIPKSQDASGALIDAPKVLPYTNFGDLISNPTVWMLIGLIFIQVIWVTMVYGPIAAYLVEAFPAKIRYSALSLPYHIGNGIFGGLLPLIGLSVIASTGNIYAGLYYPMIIATITFIVGSIFLRESRDVKIWEEVSK